MISLQNGLSRFKKVSLVPQLLCGVFLLFYLLGFIRGVENNLLVTPGFVIPPHTKIWTLLTAVFYEKSIIVVLLDIVCFVGFSLILEPLWGLKEFLVRTVQNSLNFHIFTSIISSVSTLVVTFIYLTIYTATGSLTILFAHVHGFIGLLCGYLVALKQAHPDSVAFPPPAPPTLRILHLPLLVTFVALLLGVVKVISISYCLLALNGLLVSWIYLRFYQKKESGGRGDLSESFAFPTFFPEFMHPVVSVMGENTFRVLVKLKICSKVVTTYDVGAPSSIKISLPGTTPVDAERRKQKALKALDERLNRPGQSSQISWPSLEDGGGNSSNDECVTVPISIPSHLTTNVASSDNEMGVVNLESNNDIK